LEPASAPRHGAGERDEVGDGVHHAGALVSAADFRDSRDAPRSADQFHVAGELHAGVHAGRAVSEPDRPEPGDEGGACPPGEHADGDVVLLEFLRELSDGVSGHLLREDVEGGVLLDDRTAGGRGRRCDLPAAEAAEERGGTQHIRSGLHPSHFLRTGRAGSTSYANAVVTIATTPGWAIIRMSSGPPPADVAKLADALDLGSSSREGV